MESAGHSRRRPGLGPSSPDPASGLCCSSAQGLSPWERLPRPLSETIKTMVLYTAASGATSRISLGLLQSLCEVAECVKAPQPWENCAGCALGDRLPPGPCPALFQGHTACGYCPCNSRTSSTAPGYELIRPRQGSKLTRRERREKSVILTQKPHKKGDNRVKIFANVS